jgi:hypothetical protein
MLTFLRYPDPRGGRQIVADGSAHLIRRCERCDGWGNVYGSMVERSLENARLWVDGLVVVHDGPEAREWMPCRHCLGTGWVPVKEGGDA